MIPAAAEQAAIVHAKAEYPNESVGYVVGDTYYPLENIAPDPTTNFLVSEEENAAAYAAGMEVLMHSHPNGTARPSKEDVERQIESDIPWGIVVLKTVVDEVRLKEVFYFGDQVPRLPLEGRPFRYGVYDCFHAVRDYLKEQGVADVPQFPSDYGWWETESLFEEHFEELGFVEVAAEDLQPNDVVLMSFSLNRKKPAKANHIGVYIGNDLLFHHAIDKLSKTEPLFRYRQYITGYLRYAPGP